MSSDVFVFAAATRDVPWHEAVACGWLNCAGAGGWLRLVTADEVRYGPGGREEAIERMVMAMGDPLHAHDADFLLAAAEGRET